MPNIEDSETIVLTGVQPIEIQDYETKFGAIREKAKFSVRQYIDSDHLKAAATILFQASPYKSLVPNSETKYFNHAKKEAWVQVAVFC